MDEDSDFRLTPYGRMILRAANQRAQTDDVPFGLALFRVVREENDKAADRPVWVERVRPLYE